MEESIDGWFKREILAHDARLLRYLLRVWRKKDEVYDLRQETYARVYEAALATRPRSARSFLFTTAHHLMADRLRREADDLKAVVTEGKVRIESAGSSQAVAAGTVARASDAGVLLQKEGVTEAEEALSSRNGTLVFHDVALADAVAEFNEETGMLTTHQRVAQCVEHERP